MYRLSWIWWSSKLHFAPSKLNPPTSVLSLPPFHFGFVYVCFLKKRKIKMMKNKKKWKRLLQAKNKSLHSSVTSSLVSFHWLSLTCFFLIHKLHSTPPSHLLRKRYILSLKKKLNTTSWLFVHTLVTLVIQECISFLVLNFKKHGISSLFSHFLLFSRLNVLLKNDMITFPSHFGSLPKSVQVSFHFSSSFSSQFHSLCKDNLKERSLEVHLKSHSLFFLVFPCQVILVRFTLFVKKRKN